MAAKFDPKAKAKKQKIVAAVLGVVLLGVLAWQVPSMLKVMNKKPPASTAPAPAAPVPGTPVPPATGTAPTGVATVTLRKGKKLTLQNTVDGARYELRLISTS